MFQKIVSIIISFIFLLSSQALYAEELTTNTSTGSFTILQKGDIVPFDGTLFDKQATGTVLADKEQLENKYRLNLEYELNKQKSSSDFQINNLKLSLGTCQDTSEKLLSIKNEELKEVRNIVIEQSDKTWLYLGGGFGVGIVLTLLSVYVIKKID